MSPPVRTTSPVLPAERVADVSINVLIASVPLADIDRQLRQTTASEAGTPRLVSTGQGADLPPPAKPQSMADRKA
jgi:hypothetical protein